MIVKGKLNLFQLQALDFFADALLTKQLKRHIIVHVKFLKKMDCLGLTEIEDYNLSGKPREFILDINRNQTDDEILRTLAHEMVHVKQYCYKELNEEATRWCGMKMARDLEYHEQPWEIEANDVGDIIFMDYMEKYNDKRS
jgi:hypothetical protein